MRKSILSVLVAMVMVACTKDSVEDVNSVELSAPDQITVGFADDTRIELNGEGKTVWTQGDYASVFYRSNANQKWQYQGETGERIGALKRVAVGTKTADISRVVVVYPYSENYYINPETCDVEATNNLVPNRNKVRRPRLKPITLGFNKASRTSDLKAVFLENLVDFYDVLL